MMYHVERLAEWKAGKVIYPLYIEAGPSGVCNHRCTFCAYDFLEYKPHYWKTEVMLERLKEMGRLGAKSIMFSGEGEPFLHKDILALADRSVESGIDVSFTTNGTLMTKEISERVLPKTKWIKVSVNAGTPETYAAIHRAPAKDFDRMAENLRDAVRIRREHQYACALGMQILLLPENAHEAAALARLGKDIGVDYLVVKPYSRHPESRGEKYNAIRYADYLGLKDELEKENTGDFQVIFRLNAMKKWDEAQKSYKRCLALPFWAHIDAQGNVWGCSTFIGHDRFLYGNLYEQTFEAIWTGEKRMESLRWVEACMDPARCRFNCRMDEANRYLWELAHPPDHVNFI